MTQQTSNNKGKTDGKKYLVYGVMAVGFAFCMWLIFAPSAADKEAEKQGSGFNSDIPDPRGAGIVGDKKTAYEQEQMRLRKSERMNTLDDYSRMMERQNETPEQRAAREERQIRMAPKPPEYWDNPERFEGCRAASRGGGGVRSSAAAHAELTGTLGTFFEEPPADPEKESMAAEIERLSAELAGRQPESMSVEDQFALMERSYQLAAKYASDGENKPASAPTGETAEATTSSGKAVVAAVRREQKSVVSLLSAPMTDGEFVAAFSRPRNMGFNTVGGEDGAGAVNTIAAVVHGDHKITDGQSVRLRTVEAMRVGGQLIPANTIVTGTGSISGERLEIAITAIEYDGNIHPVELTVCDSDGQSGVYIPGSMEVEAFKEIVGNMGQSLGSTINLNQQSAGEQLLTDMGRGVIQGTSQYVSKKAKQIKVRLKAGHRLFLLPKTNA
ncbi:MAG: conjugative transposon protein TraM [Alistipes sp.]|jgi:conjugative transposon TraM protein|nr:conjugative transposon protein TraM [Alistipes sp.]